MILKLNRYDSFLCSYYFSIEPTELKSLFDDFKSIAIKEYDFYEEVKNEGSLFYSFLEQHIFNEQLENLGMIVSMTKKIKYFNKYSPTRPLIGVIMMMGLSEDIELEVPKIIEIKDISDLKIKKMFEKTMLENGFFYGKETNEIKKNCFFEYDLRHSDHGNVISIIKDLEYDMMIDNDFDNSLVLNAKVGDIIVISTGDIGTDIVINKIFEKHPYDKNHFDKKKIKSLNFDSFDDFKNEYFAVAKRYLNAKEIVEKYCDFFCELYEVNVHEELCEAYKLNFDDSSDKIERKVLYDMLARYAQAEIDNVQFEELMITSFNENSLLQLKPDMNRVSFGDILSTCNMKYILMYLNSRDIEVKNN